MNFKKIAHSVDHESQWPGFCNNNDYHCCNQVISEIFYYYFRSYFRNVKLFQIFQVISEITAAIKLFLRFQKFFENQVLKISAGQFAHKVYNFLGEEGGGGSGNKAPPPPPLLQYSATYWRGLGRLPRGLGLLHI